MFHSGKGGGVHLDYVSLLIGQVGGGALRLGSELVGDEHEADGLVGVGAVVGGGCEEGGVVIQAVQVGLGGVAFDFEDIDLLLGDDDSVGAGAAMGDMLHRAAESAMERALGRVGRRAGLEALKDGFTVDGA